MPPGSQRQARSRGAYESSRGSRRGRSRVGSGVPRRRRGHGLGRHTPPPHTGAPEAGPGRHPTTGRGTTRFPAVATNGQPSTACPPRYGAAASPSQHPPQGPPQRPGGGRSYARWGGGRLKRGGATASAIHSTARGSRDQRAGRQAHAAAVHAPAKAKKNLCVGWLAAAVAAAAVAEAHSVANAERAREAGASWQAAQLVDNLTDRGASVSALHKSPARLSNHIVYKY